LSYVKVPRDAHRRKITRRAVFARDSWTCQYCGSRSNLTVDHVIPRSQGRRIELGEHRGILRPLQPPQGRPPPAAGWDASPARAAHAARRDLHPGGESDDPAAWLQYLPQGPPEKAEGRLQLRRPSILR